MYERAYKHVHNAKKYMMNYFFFFTIPIMRLSLAQCKIPRGGGGGGG